MNIEQAKTIREENRKDFLCGDEQVKTIREENMVEKRSLCGDA